MSDQGSRWQQLSSVSGEQYAAHFQELADSGQDVHGEATLCDALVPASSRILDAGCGTGRVAIRLHELGHECVGVDSDASMLEQAQRVDPKLEWVLADLAGLTPDTPVLRDPFDLVVAAGNVIPLLAEGTEAQVITAMAGLLRDHGFLIAGFGLAPDQLPLDFAPVDLESYDTWCTQVGLELVERWATWDREPYEGGGYAVSLHRRVETTR
jgi:SAM-dependent methyltransferase